MEAMILEAEALVRKLNRKHKHVTKQIEVMQVIVARNYGKGVPLPPQTKELLQQPVNDSQGQGQGAADAGSIAGCSTVSSKANVRKWLDGCPACPDVLEPSDPPSVVMNFNVNLKDPPLRPAPVQVSRKIRYKKNKEMSESDLSSRASGSGSHSSSSDGSSEEEEWNNIEHSSTNTAESREETSSSDEDFLESFKQRKRKRKNHGGKRQGKYAKLKSKSKSYCDSSSSSD